MRLWVALVVLCMGCRAARLALIPPMNNPGSSRDPDRTRPLVESYEPPPYSTKESAPGRPAADPIEVGPVSGGVTTSAALLFLLGGAAPLIGIYGEFDENDIASP